MNQVATITPARQSLIASMAGQYGMEPKAFADTVRTTCMPPNASNEEFAAFLMVAREYALNPITREIYAFPKKGGGIQPIVGIDGWMNLINSHPTFDGLEFDDHFNEKGQLTAITCKIFRKDRNRPTSVTEYMEECKRSTEPWQKWPARMLRHKAAIQCSRYAFGFAGIIDPEEAERSPEVITESTTAIAPPPPPAPLELTVQAPVEEERTWDSHEVVAAYFEELETVMAGAPDAETVEEVWTSFDPLARFEGDEDSQEIATKIKARRLAQIDEEHP